MAQLFFKAIILSSDGGYESVEHEEGSGPDPEVSGGNILPKERGKMEPEISDVTAAEKHPVPDERRRRMDGFKETVFGGFPAALIKGVRCLTRR